MHSQGCAYRIKGVAKDQTSKPAYQLSCDTHTTATYVCLRSSQCKNNLAVGSVGH